jgi:hypothetical protein
VPKVASHISKAATDFATSQIDMSTFFEHIRFPPRKRTEFLSTLTQSDLSVAADFAFVTADDIIAVAATIDAATPPVVGLLRVAVPQLQAALAALD